MNSHASMGGIERVNGTLGELPRTKKHKGMVRHCRELRCRFHVRSDGRTPHQMLQRQLQTIFK